MMEKAKLLIVTHEMAPFLELTNIAAITRKLPQEMQDRGFEIRILMPKFGNINERRNRLHEVIRLSGMNIMIDGNDNPLIIKVASIPAARMQVYFLDNEEYFKRKFVFRDGSNKFYADNDERAIFFCKGALETVKKLGWSPDIVHCHGWMSALVPVYLKTIYKNDATFKTSKAVYSIYDNCFSEKLDKKMCSKAVLNGVEAKHLEPYNGQAADNMHKGAIAYSDGIVLASENISEDVLKSVKEAGKPTLPYNLTSDFDSFFNFYNEVLEEQMVHVA